MGDGGLADEATDNRYFETAARAGHIVSGVLHLLLAYLTLRVAQGSGATADQSGALAAVAEADGGRLALWVAAIALTALALWRLAETFLGSHINEIDTDDDSTAATVLDRGKVFSLAIIYASLAWTTAKFARGKGSSSSEDNMSQSGELMQSTAGRVALVVIGLVVIGVGGYHVYKGWSRRFMKHLDTDGPLVRVSGIVGYVAKGFVLAVAGILLIIATLRADPDQAAGIDAAIKTFADLPYGRFMLMVGAFGLACYGVQRIIIARHIRM